MNSAIIKTKEEMNFYSSKDYEIDECKLKISLNQELIFISVEGIEDSPMKKIFNRYLNLEQFKSIDNYFIQFDSLSDIYESFDELINMKKISLIKEEKNIKIKIINPILKKKEFFINISMKETNIQDEIDGIISYINKLEQKINLIEKKMKEYDSKFAIYEEKISDLEKKIKKPGILLNIYSNILSKDKKIDFLDNELRNSLGGEIQYNLLYRATRDGPKTSDFNNKCSGKNNQLIILKTIKGLIFGGFTGRGFQNTDQKRINDDSVFLFSFDNQKIYKIKKGSDALYEDAPDGYGIFFGKCDGNNPIYLGRLNNDMLQNNSYTCNKGNSEFKFTKDYELNNGEKCFNLLEIEVFQIIKK